MSPSPVSSSVFDPVHRLVCRHHFGLCHVQRRSHVLCFTGVWLHWGRPRWSVSWSRGWELLRPPAGRWQRHSEKWDAHRCGCTVTETDWRERRPLCCERGFTLRQKYTFSCTVLLQSLLVMDILRFQCQRKCIFSNYAITLLVVGIFKFFSILRHFVEIFLY